FPITNRGFVLIYHSGPFLTEVMAISTFLAQIHEFQKWYAHKILRRQNLNQHQHSSLQKALHQLPRQSSSDEYQNNGDLQMQARLCVHAAYVYAFLLEIVPMEGPAILPDYELGLHILQYPGFRDHTHSAPRHNSDKSRPT